MPGFVRDASFALLRPGVLVSAFIGLVLAMAGAFAGEPKPLYLSIVPRLSATVTHRDWSPFVDRLARDIHQPVELRVFNTFEEFDRFAASARADLLFVNPYQQVMLRRKRGFIPLVRDGSKQLSGILVVRSDDPIKSLRELDGKQLAFPHPNAFGASLYMRALLEREHGVHFTPQYVTTHGNVFRNVILGNVAAGGGINVTLNQEPPAVREQLRVLYETPPVAPHPLVANPQVPAALREKIIASVLNMNSDDAGRLILKQVTLTQPMRADYTRDYQPLERLNLDKYYIDTDVQEP